MPLLVKRTTSWWNGVVSRSHDKDDRGKSHEGAAAAIADGISRAAKKAVGKGGRRH